MKEYLQKCCLLIFIDTMEQENSDLIQETGRLLSMTSSFQVTKHFYYAGDFADLEGFNSGTSKIITPLYNESIANYQAAFENAFNEGYRKVVLITSRIPHLEIKHLEEAFYSLKIIEFCIGPATDGDYYLIGMNNFEPDILAVAATPTLSKFKATIRAISEIKAAIYKLPTLAKMHTH